MKGIQLIQCCTRPSLLAEGLVLAVVWQGGLGAAAAQPFTTQSTAYAAASATGYAALTEGNSTGLLLDPAYVNINIDSGTYATALSAYGIMKNKAVAFTHALGIPGAEHAAVANTECSWLDAIQLFPEANATGPLVGTFSFSVEGNLTASASRGQNLASAGVRYEFAAYDARGGLIGAPQTGSFYRSSTGNTEGADFTGRTNVLTFVLPESFSSGEQIFLRLVFAAGAGANDSTPGVVEDVSASADLSHTLVFQGMSFARQGTPVPTQMISESGFDWSKAYTAAEIPVSLQVTPAAGHLAISWPGFATNYVLESAPTPDAGANWAPAPTASLDHDRYTVTVPAGEPAQFFRLRKTP